MEAKIEHSLCRQIHSITTSMNRCFFIVVILTMFSGILVAEIFDMDAICDPSTLARFFKTGIVLKVRLRHDKSWS